MPTNPSALGSSGVQPWQFTPETNGGKADGTLANDGVMTSGSPNLACTVSTPFAGAKPGMLAVVSGAGPSGGYLFTTVATVTDNGHVVLSANASTTVANAGVIFGTDNYTPLTSALSARNSYAASTPGHNGSLVLRPGIYCTSGPPTLGGTTLGNAIFPDPIVNAGQPKQSLAIVCPDVNAKSLLHWQQHTPQASGAVIAVLDNRGTNDGTFGPASVFGSPISGYGATTALFNNICTYISGVTLLLPFNGTYGGFDLFGTAETVIPNASVQVLATVPPGAVSYTATNASPCVFTATGVNYFAGEPVTLSGGTPPTGFSNGTTYYVVSPTTNTFQLASAPGGAAINSTSTGNGTVTATISWPLLNPNNITNQWTYGLRMPDVNNNAVSDVGFISTYGMTYGFMPSEHTTCPSVEANYCIVGVNAYAGQVMAHGIQLGYVGSHGNVQATGVLQTGGPVNLYIEQLTVEADGNTNNVFYDPGQFGHGEIRFRYLNTGVNGVGYTGPPPYPAIFNGAANMRLINVQNPSGPVASPQAPPANNTAWPNYYYRDAWITLSATTITALKIDAVTQNLPGTPAEYSFLLPAGHSYTPTFTGALAHTVTLL